jgi:hypothetical protein
MISKKNYFTLYSVCFLRICFTFKSNKNLYEKLKKYRQSQLSLRFSDIFTYLTNLTGSAGSSNHYYGMSYQKSQMLSLFIQSLLIVEDIDLHLINHCYLSLAVNHYHIMCVYLDYHHCRHTITITLKQL